METKNESNPSSDSDNEADMFCPALPPHLLQNKGKPERKAIVGPTLPANYQPLPVGEVEYDDDSESEACADVVGPLLPSTVEDDRFNVPEMEYRVKKLIKDSKNKDSGELVRESWMLELPSDKTNILALGLGGPRQFRKKNKDDLGDRSVWTDTPEDKERKARQKKEEQESESTIEETAMKKRDHELSEYVNKYEEKKRSVPLVESHQKKKKKTDESTRNERKPFSREDDLNVHKFDDAQKETIMKKARQLNDRFSSGNRKFL